MARWPWSRQPKDKSQLPGKVPKEVEDYYESAKRERVGVAWLLALGTLLVTVLLAAVLFFGGRWVYRTVFTDDDTGTGQTAEEGSDSAEQSPADDNEQEARQGQDTDTQDNQSNQADEDDNQSAQSDDTGANGQENVMHQDANGAEHDGSATTGDSTPQTGAPTTEIPNTGPVGTVAIVAAASLTGAAAHNVVSRLKNRDVS